MEKNKIKINTDGGARGNPGPAAIGVVINLNNEEKTYSKPIGETTNNVAEYQAIIFSLKKLKKLIGKKESKSRKVVINTDSELITKQINHEYKIKNEGLKEYFIELWNLMLDFQNVTIKHVKREENKEADKLVNQALDTLI